MHTAIAAAFLAAWLAAAPDTTAGGEDAPDPSQGERIDGRSDPGGQDTAGRTTLRIVATPVRAASWLVLRPLDWTVGWVERRQIPQRIYETMNSDDRLVGARPMIRYEPGYAVAIGMRYFDRRSLGPGSLVEASVRGGARSFASGFSLEPPGNIGLRLHLDFLRRNDAIFGGTEGESRAELQAEGLDVVRYRSSIAAATLMLQRRPGGGPLAVEIGGGIENRVYSNGIDVGSTHPIDTYYCMPPPGGVGACRVDPTLVPGFSSGIRLVRAQAALAIDTRGGDRFAGGLAARLAAGYAHGLPGDPSHHATARAVAAAFLPLGDRVLSLRARAGVVQPIGGAVVPFDELLSPSGPAGLRGLPRGRLRGPSELVLTLEYRWLLNVMMDAVLFVDGGNAFGPRFTGVGIDQSFATAGVALMLLGTGEVEYWQSEPRFTVQLAVSSDEALKVSFGMNAF